MKCFVIMPFSEPFNEYYIDILKPVIEECSLEAFRADEIYGTQPIIEDIAESIIDATIIIADVTGKNPNVNYELGLAHAIGKTVIIIAQDIEDIPFDYRHLRTIIYNTTKVKWDIKLQTEIKKTIYSVLKQKKQVHFIKPIKQYLNNISVENVWGIKNVFDTRQKMNVYLNDYWAELNSHLDIVGFGLKSFRDAKTDSIKDKVRNGLKLRILTLNPLSPFVKQREKDELETPGSIKKTILDLEKWVQMLKEISPDSNNVQLKFYNSLPLEFYWMQEDKLFVGPYLYGKGSQQIITFEYIKDSAGYVFYSRNFESLWSNDEFSRTDYSIFRHRDH